jgi:hypothetical protein
MRKQTAILAVAALVAVTAFCPSLVCAPAADAHACCPKHQHGQPHGDSDGQSCPYNLLAKAKSVPVALAVPALRVSAVAAPIEQAEPITGLAVQAPGATDLYLRNHVLLL